MNQTDSQVICVNTYLTMNMNLSKWLNPTTMDDPY